MFSLFSFSFLSFTHTESHTSYLFFLCFLEYFKIALISLTADSSKGGAVEWTAHLKLNDISRTNQASGNASSATSTVEDQRYSAVRFYSPEKAVKELQIVGYDAGV
jgi:hypothetical protein